MAMRTPIEITWKDKKYSILITMEVITRLERFVSLAGVARDLNLGEPKFSVTSILIAQLLAEAGVTVTQEEIYMAICTGDPKDTINHTKLVAMILSAVFPTPVKKSPTTEKPKKASRQTKKAK